jgi:hypothetical protein
MLFSHLLPVFQMVSPQKILHMLHLPSQAICPTYHGFLDFAILTPE